MSCPGLIIGAKSSIQERNSRLILFLYTARLSTLFLTTNAYLLYVSALNPTFSLKSGWGKKRAWDIRTLGGKRYSRLNMELDGKTVSSFVTPSFQNLLSAMRFHAGEKAVLSFSFHFFQFYKLFHNKIKRSIAEKCAFLNPVT